MVYRFHEPNNPSLPRSIRFAENLWDAHRVDIERVFKSGGSRGYKLAHKWIEGEAIAGFNPTEKQVRHRIKQIWKCQSATKIQTNTEASSNKNPDIEEEEAEAVLRESETKVSRCSASSRDVNLEKIPGIENANEHVKEEEHEVAILARVLGGGEVGLLDKILNFKVASWNTNDDNCDAFRGSTVSRVAKSFVTDLNVEMKSEPDFQDTDPDDHTLLLSHDTNGRLHRCRKREDSPPSDRKRSRQEDADTALAETKHVGGWLGSREDYSWLPSANQSPHDGFDSDVDAISNHYFTEAIAGMELPEGTVSPSHESARCVEDTPNCEAAKNLLSPGLHADQLAIQHPESKEVSHEEHLSSSQKPAWKKSVGAERVHPLHSGSDGTQPRDGG